MKNCYLKVYEDSVNNDNLPYLEKLVLKPGAGNTISLQAYGTGSVAPKLYGVGAPLLYNSGNEAPNPSDMNSASLRKFAAVTNNDYVYYDNKYLITIVIGACIPTDKISKYSELVNLKEVDIHEAQKLSGDISTLSTLQKIELLKLEQVNNSILTGDVAVFRNMPLIKNINIRYLTGLYGNLEEMIVGVILGGRTNAAIKADGITWASLLTVLNVKFNGNNSYVKDNNGYFLWHQSGNNYVIEFYRSSDDTKLDEETISINSDGAWTKVTV